jgi:hypothetical protein
MAQPPAGRKPQTTPMPRTISPSPRLAIRPTLLDRIAVWLSPGKRIDGIWVGCFFLVSDCSRVLGRVEEALSLIKVYDPLRYNRLVRDIDRVWVTLLPASLGQFRDPLKSCDLDERFVVADTTRPEQIAAAIVHEACHARLTGRGIGYQPELRARVEAVCFRRELAFAGKLPDGAQIRDEGERRLTGYPSDYWTTKGFSERYDNGAADTLRYLGRSELFIRNAFRLRAVLMPIRRFVHRLRRFLGAKP